MDEEMVTLHNVMPVELALKREMEYRHRMEVLKNRQLNNLNPLLPSQVQVRSYGLLPSQVQVRSYELLPSQVQVHHVSQPTIKRKEPSSSGTKRKMRSTGIVCKICDMTFCTVAHMKNHSTSLRHKNMAQQLRKRGKNVSTPFLCELCNSACSSDLVMEVHLNGTKHIEKAKKARAKFAARMH